MQEFVSFFVVLLAAVLFSQLFSRMRVPWVVALIAGGIIIGPHGLELFQSNQTIDFLASIGLVFLMFMAGLETHFLAGGPKVRSVAIIACLSGLIPGLIGFAIALAFGYSLIVAIMLGIVFMSSSVALLVPTLEAKNLLSSPLSRVVLAGAVTIDAVSLILLSLFLQFIDPAFQPAILLWYPVFVLFLLILAWVIPRLRLVFTSFPEEQDLFEQELRFIILILVGLVVFFELIGMHAIIAGFFAGLILSRSIKSRILKAKLHAIGYGFFIPVFFVVLGANTNMTVFFNAFNIIALAGVIILGSITAKIFSGFLAGRIIGFNYRESLFMGVATMPSLSTHLAIAFLGFGQGLFDEALLASIVALIIVTSTVTPILVNYLGGRLVSQQVTLRGHEKELATDKV
ncbi:MAG: cation:proton antiporter [Candidatus Paceibacterota bacterium]